MKAEPEKSEEFDRFTALVDQVLGDVGHVYAPAFGAGNAVRPATGHEVGNAVVGVLEEDDGFLESLRASIHHAIMAGENRKSMGQAKGFILLWRGILMRRTMRAVKYETPLAGGVCEL
jgi:hypothetical protein